MYSVMGVVGMRQQWCVSSPPEAAWEAEGNLQFHDVFVLEQTLPVRNIRIMVH